MALTNAGLRSAPRSGKSSVAPVPACVKRRCESFTVFSVKPNSSKTLATVANFTGLFVMTDLPALLRYDCVIVPLPLSYRIPTDDVPHRQVYRKPPLAPRQLRTS